MTEIELPYPPSFNHVWRYVGGRVLLSREGRRYRSAVAAILALQGIRPLEGPLEIEVELFPPDRRKRDADNPIKSLLDALERGGLFFDDSQFVHIDTWKRDPVQGGRALVRIRKLPREPDV